MRKIGFIGAYDKIDMIVYVGKILTVLKNKVLIIDATLNQKAKYIVPVINPTVKYITEYEEMDVAVGFKSIEEIKQYLCIQEEKELEYDYVLIDTDKTEMVQSYNLTEAEKKYFVTSFDVYSLKKGLETLAELKETINLTKILYAEKRLKEDDDYLNYLSLGHKIIWNEFRIYFPYENGDLSAIAENQRVAKIKFGTLSVEYIEGLIYITSDILRNASDKEIRRAVEFIKKGA